MLVEPTGLLALAFLVEVSGDDWVQSGALSATVAIPSREEKGGRKESGKDGRGSSRTSGFVSRMGPPPVTIMPYSFLVNFNLGQVGFSSYDLPCRS